VAVSRQDRAKEGYKVEGRISGNKISSSTDSFIHSTDVY